MILKAYAVLEKYEMTGEIFFASKAIYAARAGADEYAEGSLGGVQCRRAPWADKFAGKGVPAKLAVDHGWRFECAGCGITVDADIECAHGLPMAGICGTVSSSVYCSARCKWKSGVSDAKRKAEEARAIADFKEIVLSRFPDADFADDETEFRTHHAYVKRAAGTGFWHRGQVVVSFRYPGMEYGPACFRLDSHDKIGPPNARYRACHGDVASFEAYARASDEAKGKGHDGSNI
jgi:hypothetical protein|nr:hypothetical protein [Neorhizobium tomejilense]